MKARHHLFELLHAAPSIDDVARVRREEANGVVAPVVGQAFLEQQAVVDEGMNRQQFHRRHAERFDVLDHFGDGEARECAAQLLRHLRMLFGVAAHVGFINDRAIPRHQRAHRLFPIEVRVCHDAFGDERRAVSLVECQIVAFGADGVAEQGVIPAQLADELARVGIDQQFVWIEAVSGLGLVRSMHSIAVDGAGAHIDQVAVPDLVGVLGQLDALDLGLTVGVEQAQLDLGGIGGEQREVRALPVPERTSGMGRPSRNCDAKLRLKVAPDRQDNDRRSNAQRVGNVPEVAPQSSNVSVQVSPVKD